MINSSYKGITFFLINRKSGLWEYRYTVAGNLRCGSTRGSIQLIAERNVWALIDLDIALANRQAGQMDEAIQFPNDN